MLRNAFNKWTVLALLFLTAAPAIAEPVDPATILPEETLIYLARYGSEQTESAAKNTALGKMSADPQFERMFDQIGTAIDAATKDHLDGPELIEIYKTSKRIGKVLWQRPSALAILDGGFGDKGPFVNAALLIHAGPRAKALLDDANVLLALHRGLNTQPINIGGYELRQIMLPIPGGLYYGLMDDYFVTAIGTKTIEQMSARLKGTEKSTLAAATPFTLSRKKIGSSPADRIFTIYANVSGIVKRAQPIMTTFGGKDNASAKIEDILAYAGMTNLQVLCYEQFYHEHGCCSGLYKLQKPVPKEGGNKETAPIEIKDDQIALIPQDVEWAAVTQIDLAGCGKKILSLLKKIDPELHEHVLTHIKKLESELGFKLDEDFLGKMGQSLVIYDSPQTGGLLFSGTTVILQPEDPEKVAKNLQSMVELLAKHLVGRQLDLRTLDCQGVTIHFANPMGAPIPVAPAWAVSGKFLIVGLYPQVVQTALDRLADKRMRESSLLRNNDFLAARKVLGRIGSSVIYVNTKSAIESAYNFLLPMAQLGVAAAQGEGVKLDITALPTRRAFTQHLFPDVWIKRSDDAGEITLSYGPLPVSIGPSTALTATPVMASILLPSLSRARELSKRTVCASNLRGIGQAMYIHAQDTEKFPDNFQQLIDDNNAIAKQFHCPSAKADAEDIKACYKYIRGQGPNDYPLNVVVYEKKSNHGEEGGNVLFVDSHVSFIVPYSKVEELVKQTRKRLAAKKEKEEAEKAKAQEKE